MKRLVARLGLTVMSLLLLVASAGWICGRSMLFLAVLPTPLGEFAVRSDAHGWLAYRLSQPSWGWPRVDAIPREHAMESRPWPELLASAESRVWLSTAGVYAAWPGTQLIGLKHYLVTSLMALSTIAAMVCYRRQTRGRASPDTVAETQGGPNEDS